jgi:hypothetical protein
MASVWPGILVEESALRVHIAGLRKALGDGKSGLSYVENVTGRGYRFVASVTRLHEAPSPAAQANSDEPRCGLPVALAHLIGRDEVLATLATRLPDIRLITIAGPGGIGKTTVALAAARHASPSRFQSVWFVDLGTVADPLLVPSAIAQSLALPVGSADPMADIVERLAGQRTLIVLDNCEHLIEAAARAAEKLLTSVPGVHILATSRESLRTRGEWVLRLAPLNLPPPSVTLSAAEALGFPAVHLFALRALELRDTFQLDDAHAGLVVEICRRLDGLPLAIDADQYLATLKALAQMRAKGVRIFYSHDPEFWAHIPQGIPIG